MTVEELKAEFAVLFDYSDQNDEITITVEDTYIVIFTNNIEVTLPITGGRNELGIQTTSDRKS